MPWDKKNYPDQMGRLPQDVREKAIDIANTLVDKDGMSEPDAIEEAIERARQWDSKSRGRLESSSD